jgi:uncharacterized protein YbcC (UPF0753/DUF2309 family)
MTDKEKIRAELERQKKENNGSPLSVCNDLLSFIDSMQEEPISEDLEEAAKKAGQKYFPDENNIWARPNYEAKAAEYAFKDGANWQKEQMMKDAISGAFIRRNKYTKQNVLNGFSVTCEQIQKFNNGDKVKVIIIKE